MICCLGGPRNSEFVRCSRIQTTVPTKRKKIPVTPHICQVNGIRNDHGLDFTSFTRASTTSPDSMKGCVKSTILVLFVVIVTSPTTASYFWKDRVNQLGRENLEKAREIMFISTQFHAMPFFLSCRLPYLLSHKSQFHNLNRIKQQILTFCATSFTRFPNEGFLIPSPYMIYW